MQASPRLSSSPGLKMEVSKAIRSCRSSRQGRMKAPRHRPCPFTALLQHPVGTRSADQPRKLTEGQTATCRAGYQDKRMHKVITLVAMPRLGPATGAVRNSKQHRRSHLVEGAQRPRLHLSCLPASLPAFAKAPQADSWIRATAEEAKAAGTNCCILSAPFASASH